MHISLEPNLRTSPGPAAFAAQVLASLDQLEISPNKVNTNGGAIALGHPFGATGAILVPAYTAQLVRNRDQRLSACANGLILQSVKHNENWYEISFGHAEIKDGGRSFSSF